MRRWRICLIAGLLLAAALAGASAATATEKIRVGKSVSQPFAFASCANLDG